jgi:hypothetical protein
LRLNTLSGKKREHINNTKGGSIIMSEIIKKDIYRLLEIIISTCLEIQMELENELSKTTDGLHKEAWEKDIVTISNIIAIASAIKDDIDAGMISKCMELTLRRASREQKKKLKIIPLRKESHVKIIDSFKEIHEIILKLVG